MKAQVLFRRKTVPDELNKRPDDNLDVWVAENGNTTEETMIDFVENVIVPHAKQYGGGPGRNKNRVLWIIDGASSHKTEALKAICKRNNIDLAIIPASCTDEIQLMDVAVNYVFKDKMYYEWANWMRVGPRKVQKKSGNFVAAGFLDILSWVTKAWDSVKVQTILNGVVKCYMSSEPGMEFEVEPRPEEMKVDSKNAKKEKKKIKVMKSKSPAAMALLAAKEERARKKAEREKKKAEQQAKPKKKSTPKKKNARRSPIKRVRRKKTVRKQKRK